MLGKPNNCDLSSNKYVHFMIKIGKTSAYSSISSAHMEVDLQVGSIGLLRQRYYPTRQGSSG